MIAVDTSAIVAIALAEPEARRFGELIATVECVIGWPTVFECHQVLAAIARRLRDPSCLAALRAATSPAAALAAIS